MITVIYRAHSRLSGDIVYFPIIYNSQADFRNLNSKI